MFWSRIIKSLAYRSGHSDSCNNFLRTSVSKFYYMRNKPVFLIVASALLAVFFTACEKRGNNVEQVIQSIALSAEYKSYRHAFQALTQVDVDMQQIVDVRNTNLYDNDAPLPMEVLSSIKGGVEYHHKKMMWREAYDDLVAKHPYKSLTSGEKKKLKNVFYTQVEDRPVVMPPVLLEKNR